MIDDVVGNWYNEALTDFNNMSLGHVAARISRHRNKRVFHLGLYVMDLTSTRDRLRLFYESQAQLHATWAAALERRGDTDARVSVLEMAYQFWELRTALKEDQKGL